MINKIACLLLCTVITVDSHEASTNDTRSIVEKINTLLTAQYFNIRYDEYETDYECFKAHPTEALACIEEFFQDESMKARNMAYWQYSNVGAMHSDASIRQASVIRLIEEIIKEIEKGEDNLGFSMVIAENLQKYVASDFTKPAKEALLELLVQAVNHPEWSIHLRRCLILASGVACMEEAKPYLAKFIEEEKTKEGMSTIGGENWIYSLTWHAMRASARIYQSDDIQRCIEYIDQKGRTDYEKVRGWSSELSYLRRPEVVDYFLPFLDQEEMVVSGSGLPESIASLAVGKIVPMFSPIFDNEQRIWWTEQEKKRGRPITTEESMAFIRAWLKNPENMKKMRR